MSQRHLALLAACLLAGRLGLGDAPGTGAMIDALSDEFEAPWGFDYAQNISTNGLWYGQFRGAPEVLQLVAPPEGATNTTAAALRVRSVDLDDDPFPGAEDLVTFFYEETPLQRPLTNAERPSIVAWIHFPPVSQWPIIAGGQNYFGLRVAARDASLIDASHPAGEYYPSIWAYRDSTGQAYLRARVGDGFAPEVNIALIHSGGWYTLGMSWDAAGRTQYYGANGRGELADAHLLYTDTASSRTMDTLVYHFFSVRFVPDGALSPDFLIDRCRVFTQVLPTLPAARPLSRDAGTYRMSIEGGSPGFAYRIERSPTLAPGSWEEVDHFLSDGLPWVYSETTTAPKMFYRLSR